MLNRNVQKLHNEIIAKIIEKCGTIQNGPFPELIQIVYGASLFLNTVVLADEIKDQVTSTYEIKNLDVKFQQFQTQVKCEWCSMISYIDNSQYACHYCGKETEVFVNDRRLIIQFLSDNNNEA